jgi:hypothetical protein
VWRAARSFRKSLLELSSLKELLHKKGLNQTNKLLICLAVKSSEPKKPKEIKKMAADNGLRRAEKWNVSSLLSQSGGFAISTSNGWELTKSGRAHIRKLCGLEASSAILKVATSLREHLSKIVDSQTASFVDESVKCFESKLYRAAVVLSWAGAVSVLYQHVVKNVLSSFNSEATRRNAKWKTASTVDDLARMKESDFLDILDALSILGRSVKGQLVNSLNLRNACGHPNSFQLAEHTVAAHIETLILNVFSKF